jgi:hypothetical protein
LLLPSLFDLRSRIKDGEGRGYQISRYAPENKLHFWFFFSPQSNDERSLRISPCPAHFGYIIVSWLSS